MKKKGRKVWWLTLGLACLVVFCVSAYMITTQLIDEKKSADQFAYLREQIAQNDPVNSDDTLQAETIPAESGIDPAKSSTQSNTPSESQTAGEVNSSEADADASSSQSKYGSLAAENPDLFGWIKIDGTTIDYPVMHTPQDPEYYLRRAFDGSDSNSGTPFLAGECYLDCKNYIVYGHHMINGTMFADLSEYAQESYWREHPIIHFDTLEKEADYEVLGAFQTQIYNDEQKDAFRYYTYTDLTNEQAFNEFMNGVQSAKLYDTGVQAQFGDQLLTLSTCDYRDDNGRFVVVAREIQP